MQSDGSSWPDREGPANIRRALVAALDGMTVGVVCFSGARDDINQWRAYCPSQAGVAIRFSRRALQSRAGQLGFSFLECEYGGTGIDAAVDRFTAELSSGHVWGEGNPDAELYLLRRYINEAATFKDVHFSTEHEVRVVTQATPAVSSSEPLSNVNFRSTEKFVIPYICMPIGPYSNYSVPRFGEERYSSSEEWVIDGFVIGPCEEPELAGSAVELLARHSGLQDFEIEFSSVPLRG